MNETICTAIESTTAETASAFSFCGKGLHYDWRAIVAAAEAADLDAELAHLGGAPVRS
ncbi:MAG: hypothetical protein ACKOI2_08570 [Actinomycetota bacterium]